jgi:hypothetical protein
MTAPARRCRCRGCISDSLRRALWNIHQRRVMVAAEIICLCLSDLLKPADPMCERGRTIRDKWFKLAGRKP